MPCKFVARLPRGGFRVWLDSRIDPLQRGSRVARCLGTGIRGVMERRCGVTGFTGFNGPLYSLYYLLLLFLLLLYVFDRVVSTKKW